MYRAISRSGLTVSELGAPWVTSRSSRIGCGILVAREESNRVPMYHTTAELVQFPPTLTSSNLPNSDRCSSPSSTVGSRDTPRRMKLRCVASAYVRRSRMSFRPERTPWR